MNDTIQLALIGAAMIAVILGSHWWADRTARRNADRYAHLVDPRVDCDEHGWWVGFAGPFDTYEKAVAFADVAQP